MLRERTLVKDRYLLLRILGKGGFSEVWLADDTWTSTRVALKFYAPGTGLDDEGIQLFTHEFALLFDLNHSNLLRPSHYDHYEKMPFLVLTYCENGSALKLIKHVDEEKAWRFIQDVSAGLHYLHSCNPPIIHQDIKPDNILIDRSGRFVITDFGISTRVRNTLRRSGTSQYTSGAGTLAYMAPERFGTDPNPVNASDVYSLGATVFELLMGVPPFGEDGGLLQKKGADIPEIKGDYSPELKNVIYLCLAKDTWDRPTAFELSTNPKSIPEKRIMYPPVVPIVYPPVKSPEPGPKVPLWLIVGLSVLVLTVAAFFIANKFSGDLKQSKALSRQYYDNYIHQGDSLNDADRKEDGNYERSYVDALKKYQLALETAKDLGDGRLTSIAQEKIDEMLSRQYNYYILQGDSLNDVGRKEDTNYERSYVDALKKYQLALKTAKDLRDDLLTGNAQEKIDGMKTVILTAYEEFLSKVEKMKEYNELQAADAFLKRANSLKDFIDEEHLENN